MSCVAESVAMRNRHATVSGKKYGVAIAPAVTSSVRNSSTSIATVHCRLVKLRSTSGPQNILNAHGSAASPVHVAMRGTSTPRLGYVALPNIEVTIPLGRNCMKYSAGTNIHGLMALACAADVDSGSGESSPSPWAGTRSDSSPVAVGSGVSFGSGFSGVGGLGASDEVGGVLTSAPFYR